MEYLSRMLNSASTLGSFKFHPRCRRLKVTHLCFADDLMLFSKGDLDSIRILSQCLDKFASIFGLHANKNKSAIYLAGLPLVVREDIASQMSLPMGALPFRYLGIPLTSKKISVADCGVLIDKMTAWLRLWYCNNLSYATRLQLVSFDLMGITSYWCQLFICLVWLSRKWIVFVHQIRGMVMSLIALVKTSLGPRTINLRNVVT